MLHAIRLVHALARYYLFGPVRISPTGPQYDGLYIALVDQLLHALHKRLARLERFAVKIVGSAQPTQSHVID